MGEVYEVLDAVAGTVVALKMLKAKGAFRTLESEFETLRRVGAHPSFASVHEFGIADERRAYFTMERVRGLDLAGHVGSTGREPRAIGRLFLRLAGALEFLHGLGIVHGDLKPANVLVESDAAPGEPPVRILDFGLARAAGSGREDPSISGSVHYLAPEILRGGSFALASDLYALGVLLYEALSGRRPFDSPRLRTVIDAHLEIPPPPLPAAVPPELVRLVRRLLEKDPGDRPAGAHEVRAELLAWLGDDPTPPAESPGNVRLYLASAPLVGRDPELASLVDLGRRLQDSVRFRRERASALRMVLVSGEMGSGKTRLLEEYRYQLQRSGVLTFQVRFHEADAYALDPLARMLSAMVEYMETAGPGTIRDHGAALLRVLPQLAGRESMRGIRPAALRD